MQRLLASLLNSNKNAVRNLFLHLIIYSRYALTQMYALPAAAPNYVDHAFTLCTRRILSAHVPHMTLPNN